MNETINSPLSKIYFFFLKRFQQLLEVPMENDDEDKYTSVSDDPLSNLIVEVIKNDSLRKIERSKRHEGEHCILTAAKLISPVSCLHLKGFTYPGFHRRINLKCLSYL